MARKSNMPTIPPDMYCFSKLKTADCTIRFIKETGVLLPESIFLECINFDRHVQIEVSEDDMLYFQSVCDAILSEYLYAQIFLTYKYRWLDGPPDEWIFRDPWKFHITHLIRQWMHQKQSAHEIDFDRLAKDLCAACSMPCLKQHISGLKRIFPYLFKDCQQIGSGRRGFSFTLMDHGSLPEYIDATRQFTFTCFVFQNFSRDTSPRWELSSHINRTSKRFTRSGEYNYRNETINRFTVKLTHKEAQQILHECAKAFGYP